MDKRWAVVSGVVKQGHQVASGIAKDTPYPQSSIKIQKPFFLNLGLDLSSVFNATLNVSIHPRKFIVKNPEFTFRNVKWIENYPTEDFSFSRCQVKFADIQYPGFIYYPHPETKIAHFQNPSILEILAPFISGIQYGSCLEIMINPKEIILSEKLRQ